METNSQNQKLILTEEDANLLRNQIEQLRASLYRTDFKLSEYIDKNFTEHQKDFLLRYMDVNARVGDIERAIDKVLASILEMEPLLIKMPFEPTVNLTNWIKEYLIEKTPGGISLIIKSEIDKSMLAGVLLEYRGKIKSHTIKNDVLNIFATT